MSHPYETGLDRNYANHVPLSPLSMLRRTAQVYPERTAVIHGDLTRSWSETEIRLSQNGKRCSDLAPAQSKLV